jgi:DNA-binding MarR family transcriptional regulator
MNRPLRLPPAPSARPGAKNVLEFLRLLWAIDHALQARSKRMVRELGVTGPQRLVIRMLGHEHHATAGQLARVLHLHPSTLTGIVRRLQRSGFVARSVDATDRRRYHLALTARGRAIDRKRTGTVESELANALSDLSPADLAAAEKVLQAIGAHLSAPGSR